MKINWMIFLLACMWFWLENNYFGWGAVPTSPEELFADGLGILLMALAYLSPANPR